MRMLYYKMLGIVIHEASGSRYVSSLMIRLEWSSLATSYLDAGVIYLAPLLVIIRVKMVDVSSKVVIWLAFIIF